MTSQSIQELYNSDGEGYAAGNALCFDDNGCGFLLPTALLSNKGKRKDIKVSVLSNDNSDKCVNVHVNDIRHLRELFKQKATATHELISVQAIYFVASDLIPITRLDNKTLYSNLRYLTLEPDVMTQVWWMRPEFNTRKDGTISTKQSFYDTEIQTMPTANTVEVRRNPDLVGWNLDENIQASINGTWVKLHTPAAAG